MKMLSLVGPTKTSGTQIVYKHCPECGSDKWKLYVDPTTGLFYCFAGRHTAGGAIADFTVGVQWGLLDLVRGSEHADESVEVELPLFKTLSLEAENYLFNRGINNDTARHLGLVEMRDEPRIIIPFFDFSGVLISWTSRSFVDDAGPKYKHASGPTPLYVPARIPDHRSDHLVIVEGPFDAWKVMCAGYQAVALNGKSVSKARMKKLLTLAAEYGIITVFLDGDATAAAITLTAELQTRIAARVRMVIPSTDPGDMTPEDIRKVIG